MPAHIRCETPSVNTIHLGPDIPADGVHRAGTLRHIILIFL